MKKLYAIATIFVGAFVIAAFFRTNIRDLALELEKKQLPEETRITPAKFPTKLPTTSPIIKSEINLSVPFSAQAPFADWSLPFEEACEETSGILVDKFYKNQEVTPEFVNSEILKIVDWEKRRFGYYEHTTAEETATMMRQYFGYKRVDVLYNFTIDDMKAYLLAGHPIIVPVDGEMVGNPYYKQPGPAYHMMVLKGFTADNKFITNDVGTKRGYNYTYDANLFYNSIHDAPTGGDNWNVPDPEAYVRTGRKAIIVVYPNL